MLFLSFRKWLETDVSQGLMVLSFLILILGFHLGHVLSQQLCRTGSMRRAVNSEFCVQECAELEGMQVRRVDLWFT